MAADLVYIGCYTGESGGQGAGVAVARRDQATGALSGLRVVAATPSPSFLAWHPTNPILYAVNELPEGSVSAWAVGADGALDARGSRPTGGAHPCHVAVTTDGRHVLSANYGSGSVAVHPLDPDGGLGERADLVTHDGRGPDPERQEGPHAHMVRVAGELVLVMDLGVDRVFRYRLDGGRLVVAGPPVAVAPGTGPRHLAPHPDGRWFLTGELSGTVSEFDSALVERHRVAASGRPGHNQPAEVVMGRFLYVANRGPDTIAVFDVAQGAPRLLAEVPSGGAWPRHLAVVGDHLYVANERSHTVAAFAVDPATGVPAPIGSIDVPSPTCVLPGT